MNSQNIINNSSELKNEHSNWIRQLYRQDEPELTRKVNYNLENIDVKIVFLANKVLAPLLERDSINNTMNLSTNDPMLQKFFTDQFALLDPRTTGCDDMDTSYLRRGKNIYVFKDEDCPLVRTRQFELRFFPDEVSMEEEIHQEIARSSTQSPKEQKQKKPSRCMLQ